MLSSLNLLRRALLVFVTGDGDLRITLPVNGLTCKESALGLVEGGEDGEDESV